MIRNMHGTISALISHQTGVQPGQRQKFASPQWRPPEPLALSCQCTAVNPAVLDQVGTTPAGRQPSNRDSGHSSFTLIVSSSASARLSPDRSLITLA